MQPGTHTQAPRATVTSMPCASERGALKTLSGTPWGGTKLRSLRAPCLEPHHEDPRPVLL